MRYVLFHDKIKVDEGDNREHMIMRFLVRTDNRLPGRYTLWDSIEQINIRSSFVRQSSRVGRNSAVRGNLVLPRWTL
jgi:hypothetical protein